MKSSRNSNFAAEGEVTQDSYFDIPQRFTGPYKRQIECKLPVTRVPTRQHLDPKELDTTDSSSNKMWVPTEPDGRTEDDISNADSSTLFRLLLREMNFSSQ